MKNRTKAIIILSCALGATLPLALSACAGAETRENTFGGLIKEGKDVVIFYEKNGGVFNNAENVDFVDVYASDDVDAKGVKLLAPGDSRRGSITSATSTATRSGYNLVGWYRNIEDRVDEAGNPLDDEGNICYIRRTVTDENGTPVLDEEGNVQYELVSDVGKTQGHMYSGYWDFSTDRLYTQDLKEEKYANGRTVNAFHLYAAWAPDYTYDFYQDSDGDGVWEKYSSFTKPVSQESIAVPHWDETAGSIRYEDVPRYAIAADEEAGIAAQKFTLTGMYADPELSQAYVENDLKTVYESKIPHHGIIDLTTGTAMGTVVNIYTTWKEGNWFRIRSGEQLANNFTPDGCYEILADIDCSQVNWTLSGMTFTGIFEGNGHTISNIRSMQTDPSNQLIHGGLFGKFTAQAQLRNVTFKDVTYTISAGARPRRGATYGLFAGAVDLDAKDEEGNVIEQGVSGENFENVTITGKLLVGGMDLIPTSQTTVTGEDGVARTELGFVVGMFAGNLFGESLMALEEGGLTVDITVGAARHQYSQDKYGNPIYGYTLAVEADTEKVVIVNGKEVDNPNYGSVAMTILDSPIEG